MVAEGAGGTAGTALAAHHPQREKQEAERSRFGLPTRRWRDGREGQAGDGVVDRERRFGVERGPEPHPCGGLSGSDLGGAGLGS